MRTTAELREGFLSFFEERGHLRCPSYSLVPRAGDDSTLLVSAGMQPQMPFFLGFEQPPAPLTTTTQKVFRTVDIDVVGLDGHHLTFFEMLGNFSFGQYFKEGAVAFASEFVQEQMRLDWDRVWVTVHAGDPQMKLGPDEVAIDLWTKIGMPPERIVALPTSENFWSVGGPGPCGPDSEIYWDWGVEHGCGEPDCAPACTRCDRFLEFWNLVFMEYELHTDGTVTPLPKQNIDTGLGLERGAAILQDVRSVYETDGYQQIMSWIAAESGVAHGDSPAATTRRRREFHTQSVRTIPTRPARIRTQPTTFKSSHPPRSVSFTAKARIAPMTSRAMLPPMPMSILLSSSADTLGDDPCGL
jgi:alanyl-tRNA synthetase